MPVNPDNLHAVLEVSRATRLIDAATKLGVDQTTVSRKVTRLEKELGIRLFNRGSTGWNLTEAGAGLIPYAESIERIIQAAVERTMGASDEDLDGKIRIITPDGFGSFVLMPGISRVHSDHPRLDIEVLTSTSRGILTERDFDLAVTLEKPTPKSVSVRKIATYELHLYAHKDYLAAHEEITKLDDIRAHTLIWYVDSLLDVEPLRILGSLLPGFHARLQTNNVSGHYQAVKNQVGIAPLPSYMGSEDPNLVKVLPDQFCVQRDYWLVVPRGLERLPRIRLMINTLMEAVTMKSGIQKVAPARQNPKDVPSEL